MKLLIHSKTTTVQLCEWIKDVSQNVYIPRVTLISLVIFGDHITSHQHHNNLTSMIMSSNGNIFGVTGPLWGKSTDHRWIPLTKASDTELLSHYVPQVMLVPLMEIAGIGWRPSDRITWWRHQMDTFAALLALCAGNSPVSGEFPTHKGQ